MLLLVQILDGSDEEYCEHWADEMPIQKVDVDNVKDTRYVFGVTVVSEYYCVYM